MKALHAYCLQKERTLICSSAPSSLGGASSLNGFRYPLVAVLSSKKGGGKEACCEEGYGEKACYKKAAARKPAAKMAIAK